MLTNYAVTKSEFINRHLSCSTTYDAHTIVIYEYTLIMVTNCHAHKIVIYKYKLIMLINYDAHKIVIYKYTLVMLTNCAVTKS